MTRRRELNEYLAMEWGLDEVAEDKPFELARLGEVVVGDSRLEVFEFVTDEQQRYFAVAGASLSYLHGRRQVRSR